MENNIQDFINKVIEDDCLKVMPNIPDKSVDMILCDLPYGTTQNKWDSVIVFITLIDFSNLMVPCQQ